MNKSELAESLSNETGLPITKAAEIVKTVFDSMANALMKGESVEIRGLFSIRVRQYGGYTGRNPKTGEEIKVKPRKLSSFKCSKELKRRVMPDGLTLKRRDPRKIIDEFHSVEFSTRNIDVSHQFKIWNLSLRGICVLVKEGASVLKHMKVGDILDMKYYKSDSPEPSDYMRTEIRHITKEEQGRFRGHYFVGLAVLEGDQA
jgi:integration host factor subunit beta